LREEGEQQQSGEELRTSEAFASEIWTHKVEPSVLPWRGPLHLTAEAGPFAGRVLGESSGERREGRFLTGFEGSE
jgi:hypothetical protein